MGRILTCNPTLRALIKFRKSSLRKHNDLELGSQYIGASIARGALDHDDDYDYDDPFKSRGENEPSEAEGFGDSEQVLSDELQENGEVGSNKVSGSENRHNRGDYTLRGTRDGDAQLTTDAVHYTDGEETDRSDEFESRSVDDAVEEEEDRDDSENTEMAEDLGLELSASEVSSVSSAPSFSRDERAAVRKMMAEEQKTAAASLFKAARADIVKGRAIKRQRNTFDALLNIRIKLQKALISTNSMSTPPTAKVPVEHTEMIRAAETAALDLWTSLNDLRSSLHKPDNSRKRPFASISSTPSSNIWTEMQLQESNFLSQRRSTLTKWSQRTNPILALPRQNKFSQAPLQQPLMSILEQQLSGSSMERLIARTKFPRSCAPAQANQRSASDDNIYDDADFYTLLLRELVDQRMADASHSSVNAINGNGAMPTLPSQRDLKVKKQVDTKASKGRKMRYTVHEKLQNFMAPDDRGTWGERRREELFASLLGRKVLLDEDRVSGGEETDMDVDGGEGARALRLFG